MLNYFAFLFLFEFQVSPISLALKHICLTVANMFINDLNLIPNLQVIN